MNPSSSPKTSVKDVLAHKKNMGQYFTISDELQKFVFDKVKYKGSCLLEPSFGAGHLLKRFKELDTNYPMICYELDSTIQPTISFNDHQIAIYGDFIKQPVAQQFKTIIGNPPYVKKHRTSNLYLKFIERCYELLDVDGELIFIVPSDFIKLTSASALIDTMTKNGAFTDFLFPHDEKLFEGASIDVLIFRYEKGNTTKQSVVNGKNMFCNVNNGIITFSDALVIGTPLSDLFNVYVGLVSGRDEIYRVPIGNIDVLNDKGRTDKYIFAETFPTSNTVINTHLLTHKAKLLERKIKKFSEENWFEWGAPRNIKSIQANMGKPCIYVRNMTRNKEIAFIDTVQYFGGGLLCLLPTALMTQAKMKSIVALLNSNDFQKDYLYSGRFKIGHKQVSNVIVPN
jgi:adenine-specific DNA-methyltransferase